MFSFIFGRYIRERASHCNGVMKMKKLTWVIVAILLAVTPPLATSKFLEATALSRHHKAMRENAEQVEVFKTMAPRNDLLK